MCLQIQNYKKKKKKCGMPNYFAVCCQESKMKVLAVDYTSEDQEYEYVAETVLVNGKQEKFQLDSGSTVNNMTDETVIKFCGQNGLR